MMEVFGGDSPNVIKVLILLEELGMKFVRRPLDVTKGEQFTAEFLAIGPNNRVPVIVDHAPADGGPPLSVFESGAILLYLAEKTGALLPTEVRARSEVHAWLMWQMGGQGPMLGQAGQFRNYAPESITYGIERYTNEAARLYRVLDTRLKGREFIVGGFSIADIACWPWLLFRNHHGIGLDAYPEVARWFHAVADRPAIKRIMEDVVASDPPAFDDEAKRILFNIT